MGVPFTQRSQKVRKRSRRSLRNFRKEAGIGKSVGPDNFYITFVTSSLTFCDLCVTLSTRNWSSVFPRRRSIGARYRLGAYATLHYPLVLTIVIMCFWDRIWKKFCWLIEGDTSFLSLAP